MRFQNKVCVVTGGASGIGRATARQMGREGGLVAVVDIHRERACMTADLIGKEGGHSLCFTADVGDPEQVQRVVTDVVRVWGSIDVLINNAGTMTHLPVTELSVDDWDHVLNVNLRGAFVFCKYALPHIQNGAIVNVSSVHAHATTANVAPYAASKAGLEALTRALSREHPPDKVRINAVAPGAVDTPMLWSNPNLQSGAEKLEGEVATPEEIAAAICFLASHEARFINGATLRVDGGRLSQL
jgi:NAD(P)-dependent dehydrogenase (short-subunit alcohol dehydrogenase family)